MKVSLGVSSLACGWAMMFGASLANATTVQFQTVMGDFEVNLYDEATPETVANFLAYIEDEAFNDSFFHRSVPDFIIQGGGFVYDLEDEEADAIVKKDEVDNEPVYSNRRGTIAMAKVGNDPNSATSQWFFNLKDNHANLDVQNGGFTVFGEVVGDGMDVIDAIAELPRYRISAGAFSDVPLRNYTNDDIENEVPVSDDHLVIVTSIQVLDADPDTAADLDPVPNTLIDQVDDGQDDSDGDSGGGSFGWFSLLLLAGLGLRLRKAS